MPPSTLSKNRLFIERDNKNRRITSNFGTTFKNSKWTSYTNSGTKNSLKAPFRRFFFYFFLFSIFVLFLYFFQEYYVCSYLYNKIYVYFWGGVDVLDYQLSYCFWATAGFISFTWHTAYSYFFFNNLSMAPNSKCGETVFEQFKRLNPPKKIVQKIESPKLDKTDADWTLFSFTNDVTRGVHKILESKIVENLFDRTLGVIKWIESFSLYIDLFKSTYFVTWVIDSKNALFSNYYFQKLWNHNWFPNPYEIHYTTCKQMCAYISQFTPERRRELYEKLLNSRFGAFINLFHNFKKKETQNLKTNFLVKNKTGSFNFWDLKHDQLVNLLTNVSNMSAPQHFLDEQIKIMKMDRWLYRYSTLGRKILKNSHKLTLSKKVLNCNDYSKTDFKKNLWTSINGINLFKSNSTLFNNLNSFFYGEPVLSNEIFYKLRNNIITNALTPASANINNLQSYENSYFWFLKRMYNFNNLSAHEIRLQKKLEILDLSSLNNNLFKKKLLKDNFFFKNIKTFVTNNEINFFNEKNIAILSNIAKGSTDLYLNYSDYGLYNKETTALFSNLFSQFNRNAANSSCFLYADLIKSYAFTNCVNLNKAYARAFVNFNIDKNLTKSRITGNYENKTNNFIFKNK